MKRLAIILAAATLVACSSVGDPRFDVGVSETRTYDAEYIKAVERQARWLGTEIIWLHPPEVDEPIAPGESDEEEDS
jgi:hypothetical protein